jgi:SAM-dependent methyltransferase
MTILDAGFGYGNYSYFLARKYPAVFISAVEIDRVQVERFTRFAEKCGLKNIKTEVCDLRQLNYEGHFNLVLSVDVIEHIAEDCRVFENFYRALKPAGALILHTPYFRGGAHSEATVSHPEHIRPGYKAEEIENKLRGAGFKRVEHHFTYGSLGMVSWKLLQEVPLKLISKSRWAYLLLPFYFLLMYPVSEALMSVDSRRKNKNGGGILVTAWK